MEHRVRMKQLIRPFIENGSKDLEVGVADYRRRRICVGDTIVLVFGVAEYRRRVRDVRRYASFEAMLHCEDACRIMPGWSPADILKALRSLFIQQKEALGVLVFELEAVT